MHVSRLLDVFSEWFRSFGYSATREAQVPGTAAPIPLLMERDARRVAVFGHFARESPDEALLRAALETQRSARCDHGVFLSLGPVAEAHKVNFQKDGLSLWDAKRIVQELGEAVLSETCPELWARSDPLASPKPSRLLDNVQQQAAVVALPAAPVAPLPADPRSEPVFPAAVAPVLAPEARKSTIELELPPAFGIFDEPAPTPVVVAAAPPPSAPAPTPAIQGPPGLPLARSGKQVLRTQVSKALAVSMAKKKVRTVDRAFLRLAPFHVYDYEANLLVEGSLDADVRKGRMAVDASLKKVVEWSLPLETGEPSSEGADIDEKKIRIADPDAQGLLQQELVKLVTRDVVMAEDGDEWSVVVKKKVTLGPSDVKLTPLGVFWVPIWRVSGKDGSVEIDASTGNVVFEEILTERHDAQLV